MIEFKCSDAKKVAHDVIDETQEEHHILVHNPRAAVET